MKRTCPACKEKNNVKIHQHGLEKTFISKDYQPLMTREVNLNMQVEVYVFLDCGYVFRFLDDKSLEYCNQDKEIIKQYWEGYSNEH